MKKLACLMSVLLVALVAFSCSTKDVDWPDNGIEPDDLYEITDVAFAQYLIYNITNTNADRKLPYGTAIEQDGKYYINKEVAKTVTKLYLVKDDTRMAELEAAGVPTANTKITNIDGVQYFINVEEIRLTSNQITGALDLSSLSRLKTLEMNSNFVNALKVPSSIVRLRYAASTSSSAPDNRWLTALNLSECSQLEHAHLRNQHLTQAGLVFPRVYENLTYVNLTGNSVTIEVSQEFYDNLTSNEDGNRGGLVVAAPGPNTYEIPDRALGEYLVYNCTLETDAGRQLPAGTAYVDTDDGKIYINTDIAATATVLYVNKSNNVMNRLESNYPPEFTTARTKITNMDGMQYFTRIKTLNGTSNELAADGQLKLANLTALEELTFATAGVSTLDLSNLVNLKTLDVRGSASSSLGKLTALDLRNNINIETVNANRNRILPADFVIPTSYASLTSLDLGRNGDADANVIFMVPQALYDQITNSDKGNYLLAE